MPFLAIGGVTVPVALGELTQRKLPVGRAIETYNGGMRSAVRARKWEWTVPTQWMTEADADTLRTALEGTPPLTCSGDLTTHDVVLVDTVEEDRQKFATGEHVRLTFTIRED